MDEEREQERLELGKQSEVEPLMVDILAEIEEESPGTGLPVETLIERVRQYVEADEWVRKFVAPSDDYYPYCLEKLERKELIRLAGGRVFLDAGLCRLR